ETNDTYGMSSSSETLSSETPLYSSSEFVASEALESSSFIEVSSDAAHAESSIDATSESSEAMTALVTHVSPFSISHSAQGLIIGSELNGVAHIKIWDVMGQLLLSQTVHTGNNSLPTHISTGLLIYGIEHSGTSDTGVFYWVR
ncbi:MAG: hypothetical protein OCD01_02295, partial [Fibrobacterales bacterium]